MSPKVHPQIALCYVRLSRTKSLQDFTSVERQRENILSACQKYGWIPEWYEDAEGHKSAMTEANRPNWMALRARLSDPDITVVVVNDQSRAMRNTLLAMRFFEQLARYDVKLHLAAQDSTLDFTLPESMSFAQLQAIIDDNIAQEASQRIKESVKHRQSKGQTLGFPPFGTVRIKGYLAPSQQGIWLFPNGSIIGGMKHEQPSVDAVWRGYYECAREILSVYIQGDFGNKQIAIALNNRGYWFKDRNNNPRPIVMDDVRRVVANWPAYAGLVGQGKAIDTPTIEWDKLSQQMEVSERAVFDLDLLRRVSQVQKQRSFIKPKASRQKHDFPLAGVLFCTHCEHNSLSKNDPNLRARLIGWRKQTRLRYRHSETAICSGQRDSIFAELVEEQFLKLIQAFNFTENAQKLLSTQATSSSNYSEEQFTQKRENELVRIRRATENVKAMGLEGFLDTDKLLSELRKLREEEQYWMNLTTTPIPHDLRRCTEILYRLQVHWHKIDGQDQRRLIEELFEKVLFDIEEQRITGYRLKTWARFYLRPMGFE